MRLTPMLAPLCLLLAQCGAPPPPAAPLSTPEGLAAQSQEFERGVEQVLPGVWVAIGFGLANAILIEAPEGLIVIDTMATMEEGRAVAREFRRLSDKPLRAIIYTHNHADHVFGAEAFVAELADPDIPVQVFGQSTTAEYVHRIVSEYRPIITARSFRMFGTHLTPEALVNEGIGPKLAIDENSTFGFITPGITVRDRARVSIAGLELELIHAPGETEDGLLIWWPERGVLAVGDNIYKAFPNLYTIRGTPYRSPKQWAASIDLMRELPVDILLPSHTRPLQGRAEVQRVLTAYRDGIRYVHDQTVRWTNAGLTPDEIAARIKLPPHLAAEPYLQEYYGRAVWSARSVFAGNLGWFDGNPSSLNPLPPLEVARRMQDLAGGGDALRAQLQAAVQRSDYQWALRLSDHLLRLDPTDQRSRALRIEALTRLGEADANPNGRHYYLMSAMELREGIRLKPTTSASDAMIRAIPMATVMDAFAMNLRAEETLDMDRRVVLHFDDTGESWTLWLRRGVLETVDRALDGAEIEVRMDALIWKKLLGRQLNPAVVLARHTEFEQGNALGFSRFLLLFKPPREAPEPAPLATVGL